jgi:Ca-activated chloride channel family protein
VDLFGIHFAEPQWLWALIALPLVLLMFYLTSRTKRSTLAVGHPVLVAASHGTFRFQAAPWLLRLSVIALCLLAAARPQAGRKKIEQKQPVTDLFIALDLSSSMLADDLKPNRVSAAKQILSEFLDQVKGARVGLEVFAGRSFTQCPLTTDTAIVRQLLSHVDVFSVRLDGTAIGDGLASCVNRLKKGVGKDKGGEASKQASTVAPESQAIILLTDGENNQGIVDPQVAAKLAAREGITIYAIGVGTPKGVPAPYPMEDGTISYALDPKGDIIMTRLTEGPLKEIAAATGGKYYRASDNRTLAAVLSDIARMEKREVVSISTWEYQELAPRFLLVAFLLLALDVLLGMTWLRILP